MTAEQLEEPTEEKVYRVCYLYREDFESLSDLEKSLCMLAARGWLDAWRKELKNDF